MSQATFDNNDHCVTPGWARSVSYHTKRRRFLCLLDRHRLPTHVPVPTNGHSPSNSERLPCCGTMAKWYVEGQHRWGGIDRYFLNLEGADR